jgi:hypothetical protein
VARATKPNLDINQSRVMGNVERPLNLEDFSVLNGFRSMRKETSQGTRTREKIIHRKTRI